MFGTLAWAAPLRAQPRAGAQRPWRIGMLTMHDVAQGQVIVDMFATEMRARGLETGRDYLLEVRHGERSPELIEARAKELAALPVDLLVGGASAATTALGGATRSKPIVGLGLTSPVESGLVQSLARPGGNITGSTFNTVEVGAKVLEILLVAAPGVRRVAVIRNPTFPGMNAYAQPVERTAQNLGLTLAYIGITRPDDFRPEELERARPDALYVVNDYAVGPIQPNLAAYATARRLPSIGVHRTFTQAGGLLSLNADSKENFVAGADYAIRILQGADPASLPIQAPTRFQLVFNRRTAEAIGFVAPRELMLRVNEVIS